MGQHEATLVKVLDSLQRLSSSINRFNSSFDQHSVPDATSILIPSASGPVSFVLPVTSSLQTSKPFIQCSFVFSRKPSTCPTNVARITFVSSLLSGRAAFRPDKLSCSFPGIPQWLDKVVFVYIDDFLFFSCRLDKHLNDVTLVLQDCLKTSFL